MDPGALIMVMRYDETFGYGFKRPETRAAQLIVDQKEAETQEAIEQANLGTLDTAVAKRYLVDKAPLMEIAVELDCDRSTIGKRLPPILKRIEATAVRLFPANTS